MDNERILRGFIGFLPQEQTSTNTPPYVNSTTGFIATDPLHPTFVTLTTQASNPASTLNIMSLKDLVP